VKVSIQTEARFSPGELVVEGGLISLKDNAESAEDRGERGEKP
jgi:hypothetical protein